MLAASSARVFISYRCRNPALRRSTVRSTAAFLGYASPSLGQGSQSPSTISRLKLIITC
jgi:hypothetical protein